MAISSESARKPFISFRNATFRLGDRLVFEGINWTLHQSEQWAVIGPNGSGKTLLADALRGRLPLVQGELRYHFRPTEGLSLEDAIGHVAFEDRKFEVHGTVVQSRWTSFEEEASLSVGEFLSFERVMEINPFEVSVNHRSARAQFESRVQKAIRLLQIEKFLSRNLLTLSNGERQRLQMARALARPLRLLVLDEPYTGLDVRARDSFQRILEQLLQSRLRVLLLTARTEDLPRHVTHLLRLDKCEVADAGRREVVLATSPSGAAKGVSRDRTTRHVVREGAKQRRAREHGRTIVELRNVTVHYGSAMILNNLNWTVKAGESWAVLGPNGSGKTTLLSLIQGDNPQAYVNHVKVFGRQRGGGESVWHLKKRIGWVSPELQLHFDENVSVLDAVLSGCFDTIGLFESPTRRQVFKAQSWLRRFGLSDYADAPLFSLSAGLQRMTLLARALVKDPPLVILDEPCQGLDPAHRQLIVQNVDDLIRSGSVSVILVTHRQEEIPRSIRRVLRLRRNDSVENRR